MQPAALTAPSHVTRGIGRNPAACRRAIRRRRQPPIPLAGVAIEIASKALAGKNHFEIRLDPPELGRIEVRLDVDRDGNVTSRLIADRSDTLDLLRRDATGLERALQDAGLKTADNGLQFSLRDQSMGRDQTNTPTPDAAQLVVEDDTLPGADTTSARLRPPRRTRQRHRHSRLRTKNDRHHLDPRQHRRRHKSRRSGAAAIPGVADNTMIASNFTTFLQLLTTQLKNQNPLDPLDTNQFTQQLVQFAQVEQQMKSNDQLTTLVSLEKSAQSTTALAYVGATVVVDGSTAQLANGSATWSLNVSKPSTATVTIKDATGQTAYSGTFSVNPGSQKFSWDGRGNDGKLWPDGSYTMTATGVDANGQSTGISTEVQATVDSVDLTQNPPLLSINGQNYTMDKIKRIIRPGS